MNNIDSVQSAITILTHFENTNKYDNIRDYSKRSFYTCLLRVGYSPQLLLLTLVKIIIINHAALHALDALYPIDLQCTTHEQNTYIYTHAQTHTHTRTHAHTHTHTHACMHTHTHTYTCKYKCKHTYSTTYI